MKFAPRLSLRLLKAIDRIDDGRMSFAELCRLVGREAERVGGTRPSYQCVRVVARRFRLLRGRTPSTASVILDIAFRARPPQALAEHLWDAAGERALKPGGL